MTSSPVLDPELQRRYRRLSRFYDVHGTGLLSMAADFLPVSKALAAPWRDDSTPVPHLLQLLIDTYQHETDRRDLDHNGVVDEQEFVDSHAQVVAAFNEQRSSAEAFIAKAAGGFFDCLDLDRDGVLQLDDLKAYATAYGKPTAGIAPNLARMLACFGLPPDRLPRPVFLTLVMQYWFDPSPEVPGRWLFDFDINTAI